MRARKSEAATSRLLERKYERANLPSDPNKKDVSHIENDGLDLSKRKKQANKGGVILLDTNGESCDGDASDGDESSEIRSSNFTFVGAEIRTGKSSIRSKQKGCVTYRERRLGSLKAKKTGKQGGSDPARYERG